MSAFSALMQTVTAEGEGQFKASITDSWLQGRTAFGGLSTALVTAAMRQQVASERRLRALSVSFVGPAPAGDHQVLLRPLREGGSVTHIQGELQCDSEVATMVTAAYGKDRASAIVTPSAPRPANITSPEDSESMPYIEGITPAFTQHFDMRLASGSLPFSGADSADFAMWLAYKDATVMDENAMIGLADAPPMPGLNQVKGLGVGSSLSWYLEFPELSADAQHSEGLWYLDYRCQAGSKGYFSNYATIYAPNGEAAMFSRQVATVFEK